MDQNLRSPGGVILTHTQVLPDLPQKDKPRGASSVSGPSGNQCNNSMPSFELPAIYIGGIGGIGELLGGRILVELVELVGCKKWWNHIGPLALNMPFKLDTSPEPQVPADLAMSNWEFGPFCGHRDFCPTTSQFLHLRFCPWEKIENICGFVPWKQNNTIFPVVKSIPFKTNRGKNNNNKGQ